MDPEISVAAPGGALAGNGLSPALFQSIFWKPRFQASSPITIHIPFLFWTVAALRPKRIAVLGCDDGVAHFALCQAIDKLGIDGIALGIGYWTDANTQQPAANPPAPLTDHQQMLYEQQSRLLSHAALEALPAPFNQSKFNLLLVDLCAIPFDQLPRIDELLKTLAPGGVLVIHGLAAEHSSTDINAELLRLQRSHQQLIFEWGLQLALFVVPNDNSLSSFLDSLTHGSSDDAVRSDLAMVLRRCGEGLSHSVELAASQKYLKGARGDAKSLAKDLKNFQDKSVELEASIDTRGTKIAMLQSELFDLREQLSKAQQHSSAFQIKLQENEQQLKAITNQRQQLEARVEQERKIRFDETAILTQIAEQKKAKQSELEQQLKAITNQRQPEYPHHVWKVLVLDVQHVQGYLLKAFLIIDDFSFQCLGVQVSRRYNSSVLRELLDQLLLSYQLPSFICINSNQKSFIAGITSWAEMDSNHQISISSSSDWCNGFSHAVASRLKCELLHNTKFKSVSGARKRLKGWCIERSLMQAQTGDHSGIVVANNESRSFKKFLHKSIGLFSQHSKNR